MQVQYCKRCVMSNESDRNITFDEHGFCNYCTEALDRINTVEYFPNEEGERRLNFLLDTIKKTNKNNEYDCVMGISGGLDSSYLAYLGHKWGLRILAVHIDDGYDTEISKRNIKKLCETAKIELRTITPDEKQYNNLILAYMKAGVPNIAIPQDNILLAFLYDTVKKEKLKYFLSGGNFALESILQRDHVFNSMDIANIKDIHKRFGTEPIDKLRFISSYKKYAYDKLGIVVSPRPLDLINYNRNRAFKELNDFCGFEYYGRKHLENILTTFIQLIWMPKKFGVDKRNSHLSSMIVSGQMTREEAMNELKKPILEDVDIEKCINFIAEKMGITSEQFYNLLDVETHEHDEYKTDGFAKKIRKML